MKYDLDQLINENLNSDIPSELMSKETSDKILNNLSSALNERKKIMKFKNTKKTVLIAAAILAFGSITAIAAGKIKGLRSGVNLNDVSYTCAADVKNEKRLGNELKAVDSFKNGISLEKGYFITVEGTDENQNTVETYPSVTLDYEHGITLSIDKFTSDESSAMPEKVLLKEEINGTSVTVTRTEYLFLPADMEPSDKEAELSNNGELVISYGSEKPERKTFIAAKWMDGDLTYTLHSFDAHTADEMMSMAEEIINAG